MNVDLNFTKALSKDYILYNQTYTGPVTSCTHKLCENNLLCKNDDFVEEDEDSDESK